MTALTANDITAAVQQRLPTVDARTTDNGKPFLCAKAADLEALLRFLRDEPRLRFDAVMDLTGYDLLKYPSATPSDAIAVVYLLWSHTHRHKVTVKAFAERAACRLPSASAIWPAAIYFEREVFDLLGVHFDGHPDLRRIMCPEDWIGHPLRKDYVYPADYHGVPHLRDGQHFENSPLRSPS